MENSKKTISASEINRFIYCPYQWYYERLYGKKYIMQRLKERNEKYGYENSEKSNFKRGLKHHKKEYRMNIIKSKLIKIIFICLLFIAVLMLLKVIPIVE